MALGRACEVLEACHRLVANVAVVLGTLLAREEVECCLLLIEFTALRAESAVFDVYGRILSQAKELLDHLGRDLVRKQRPLLVDTLRVLLEVFLTLRWLAAGPAHVVKADGALDMGASALDLANPDLALGVRTELRAPLDVQISEHGLVLGVVLSNFVSHCLILLHEVDSIDKASLERVHVLPAVETEVDVAVLAAACVVIAIDIRNRSAAWHGAPADIIHLGNCVLDR